LTRIRRHCSSARRRDGLHAAVVDHIGRDRDAGGCGLSRRLRSRGDLSDRFAMANGLLITGTDTGVGKTMVGCALGFAMKVRGLRVGVMKPAETGCREEAGELIPNDAVALRASASANHPLEIVCPYRYRSPLAPAAAAEADRIPPPDPETIVKRFEQ